ncbi:CHC2 zinc finger domain-containing protein, partial [Bdellovibrionota bacterium]
MGAFTKRIPDNVIEEIKHRINIVETISRFVELKRAGSNFKGLCPFHMEKTPSFMVSEEKEIFHCFGCGVGGNVFSFLVRHQGKTFPEVVRELAGQVGVHIPEDVVERPKRDEKKGIFRANKFAARYFHHLLLGDWGKGAKDY